MIPKDHQKQEAAFLAGLPGKRGMLLSETGTGKTVTLGLLAAETPGSVLWLTAKSLVPQATRDLETLGFTPFRLGKAWKRDSRPRLVLGTHGEACQGSHLDQLTTGKPWDLLIVDEGQAVGGGATAPSHKRYQAVKTLSGHARAAVLSTAEPLASTHGLDLWALGDAIQIPHWPSRHTMGSVVTWQEFNVVSKNGYRFKRKEPGHLTEHGERLLFGCVARCAIRTTLDQVLDGVPRLARHEHPVPLTVDAAAAYASVDEGGLTGHHLRTSVSRDEDSLVPHVVDLITGRYATHASVVVFTERYDLLEPLADAFTRAAVPFVAITGQHTSKQRQDAVDRHRAGDVPILLGTEALEEGLNIQHASLLVSVVQSYSPAREKQREGRLRRIGSPHAEITHAIVYPDVPLEARRQQLLDQKAALVQRLWQTLKEGGQSHAA